MGFDPLSSCENWLETMMSTRVEEGKKVKSTDCTANMRERPISGNSSSYQCVMLRREHQHIDEILVGPLSSRYRANWGLGGGGGMSMSKMVTSQSCCSSS